MNYVLIHHGIKGQKWGVRNGPPYPLKTKLRSAGSSMQDNMNAYGQSEFRKIRMKVYYSDPDKIEEQDMINRILKNKFEEVSELPKMTKLMDTYDNSLVVNPGVGSNPNRFENCVLCSTAMAMREKGYDVQAQESWHPWDLYSFQPIVWPGSKTIPVRGNFDSFDKKLRSCGNGAYGTAVITWKKAVGTSHAIFWKNENGKTRYFDGQTGGECPPNRIKEVTDNKEYAFTRLDNVEPSNIVLGWVEPRK